MSQQPKSVNLKLLKGFNYFGCHSRTHVPEYVIMNGQQVEDKLEVEVNKEEYDKELENRLSYQCE